MNTICKVFMWSRLCGWHMSGLHRITCMAWLRGTLCKYSHGNPGVGLCLIYAASHMPSHVSYAYDGGADMPHVLRACHLSTFVVYDGSFSCHFDCFVLRSCNGSHAATYRRSWCSAIAANYRDLDSSFAAQCNDMDRMYVHRQYEGMQGNTSYSMVYGIITV